MEKDWIDEALDKMTDKEKKALLDTPDHYYWHERTEDLYRLGGKPMAYSVSKHDWVWSEDAAGILIGETWADPIDESEVQGYIDRLEKKYGGRPHIDYGEYE